MSIKKPGRVWLRTWKTGKGVAKSAWAVDYHAPDPLTGRLRPHRKQFATELEALAFNAHVFVEAEAGTHVPDSQTCTVAEPRRAAGLVKEHGPMDAIDITQLNFQQLEDVRFGASSALPRCARGCAGPARTAGRAGGRDRHDDRRDRGGGESDAASHQARQRLVRYF
jgi:hypothetical protein